MKPSLQEINIRIAILPGKHGNAPALETTNKY